MKILAVFSGPLYRVCVVLLCRMVFQPSLSLDLGKEVEEIHINLDFNWILTNNH